MYSHDKFKYMLTLCLRTRSGLTTDYQTGKPYSRILYLSIPHVIWAICYIIRPWLTDPQYSVSSELCHKPSWSTWGRTPNMSDCLTISKQETHISAVQLSGWMEDCKFDISAETWSKLRKIISQVKAPADGKSRCQDWGFEVFILRTSSARAYSCCVFSALLDTLLAFTLV